MQGRTLESIVATHELARTRVSQGLPVWDRKIHIKAILNRDPPNTTSKHVVAISHDIGKLLRSRLPAALLTLPGDDADLALMDIVEDFEGLKAEADALANFNDNLSCLYDWADANRVWLGAQ